MVPLAGNICTNLIANGTIGKDVGANGKNGNTIGTNGTKFYLMLPTNGTIGIWEKREHTQGFKASSTLYKVFNFLFPQDRAQDLHVNSSRYMRRLL